MIPFLNKYINLSNNMSLQFPFLPHKTVVTEYA